MGEVLNSTIDCYAYENLEDYVAWKNKKGKIEWIDLIQVKTRTGRCFLKTNSQIVEACEKFSGIKFPGTADGTPLTAAILDLWLFELSMQRSYTPSYSSSSTQIVASGLDDQNPKGSNSLGPDSALMPKPKHA